MKVKLFMTIAACALLGGACKDELHAIYPTYVEEKTEGYEGYELVWAEEFDYEGLPDPACWVAGDWGGVINDEPQDYRKNDLKYTHVENGNLILETHKDPHEGTKGWGSDEPYHFEYSSGEVHTKGKYEFQYGRIDIAAKIPVGKGAWPAFWLMPAHGNDKYAEIDIMEFMHNINNDNQTISGTLHIQASRDGIIQAPSGKIKCPTLKEKYHLYSLIWDENKMEFLFDNEVYFTYEKPAENLELDYWNFDQPFFLIMNIAVGPNWGDNELDESLLPLRMEVDYIRYYKAIKNEDNNDEDNDEVDPPMIESELITNGDFENGLINWEKQGDIALEGNTNGDEAISGEHSIRMTDPTGVRGIWQDVNVSAGSRCTFSFIGRIRDSKGGSQANQNTKGAVLFGRIYQIIDGSKGKLLKECMITDSENTYIEDSFDIPEGVNSIRVMFYKESGIGYVDEVSLKSSNQSVSFVDPETPRSVLPFNKFIGNKWSLNFSDEFNQSIVDNKKWSVSESSVSRGERPNIGVKEWYWLPQNVKVETGNLVLNVRKENEGKMTCGAIESKAKFSIKYGYFEARIKIADTSKGSHTAFWLMPTKEGNDLGTGKDGAEIDIFESAFVADEAQTAIHIDGYGDHHQQFATHFKAPNIHDGNYHIFGLLWTPVIIQTFYDGELVATYNNPKWISQVESYLILSDGANFGEKGDQYFINQKNGYLTNASIDYVRVWKNE